jgi:hypothetical protein
MFRVLQQQGCKPVRDDRHVEVSEGEVERFSLATFGEIETVRHIDALALREEPWIDVFAMARGRRSQVPTISGLLSAFETRERQVA